MTNDPTPDTVRVEIKPSMQLLQDILDAALYRSIDHWAVVAKYVKNTDAFPYLVVREMDNDKEPEHEVTTAVLVRGIQLVLENMNQTSNAYRSVYAAVTTDDASPIDSDAADCIVQMGLLGKIVYS